MSKRDDFNNYYKDLLIAQYHELSKAQSHIEMLSDATQMQGLPYDFERAFDIDTAVGNQLTILGKYVGVERTIFGYSPSLTYFELIQYTTSDLTDRIGFRTYTLNPNAGSVMYSYTNRYGSNYVLSDEYLRILIKLKILFSNQISSYAVFKEVLFNSFGYNFLTFDNKDMSYTVIISNDIVEIMLIAIYLNIFPKPACVLLNVFKVEYPYSLFSLCDYSGKAIDSLGLCTYDNVVIGNILRYKNKINV